MEALSLTLQAAMMLGLGRVACGLLDGIGLIRTLVNEYVANAEAATMSRLWAVIVMSSLVETLATGDDQPLNTSPGQQVRITNIVRISGIHKLVSAFAQQNTTRMWLCKNAFLQQHSLSNKIELKQKHVVEHSVNIVLNIL